MGHPHLGLNVFGKWYRCWSILYGAYSSRVERLIVDQKAAGSSPARRPNDGCVSRSFAGTGGHSRRVFFFVRYGEAMDESARCFKRASLLLPVRSRGRAGCRPCFRISRMRWSTAWRTNSVRVAPVYLRSASSCWICCLVYCICAFINMRPPFGCCVCKLDHGLYNWSPDACKCHKSPRAGWLVME